MTKSMMDGQLCIGPHLMDMQIASMLCIQQKQMSNKRTNIMENCLYLAGDEGNLEVLQYLLNTGKDEELNCKIGHLCILPLGNVMRM